MTRRHLRMTNIISKTLQIKDSNVIFNLDYVEEKDYKDIKSLFYFAKLTYKPSACPECGIKQCGSNIVKNGTRTSTLKLTKVSGLPAFLKLKKQRFFCKACRSSFTAKSSIVNAHCFITNRVKQLIADKAADTVTKKYIAKECNVSEHTVQRVIHDVANDIRQRPTDALPKHLSFDEFKSVSAVDASMSFICLDNVSHRLVDIVYDRRQSSLEDYFLRYSRETRNSVETICIDMFTPYMTLANKIFPQANIIIDRFHIVQALNRELNSCRVAKMNSVRYSNPRLYNKFKRYWKVLLAKEDNLHHQPYAYYRLFDWLTNTQGIATYLLDQDKVLAGTYRVVHDLRNALQCNDYQQFTYALSMANTHQISDGLKKVIRTLKKLSKHIQNTFQYKELTNGPVEGTNNKIKVLKRGAYGYRNYQNFRDRILLTTRLYIPEDKKIVQAA